MEFPFEQDGLTIEGVHSPRWSNRERIQIDCTLVTKEFGEIPFTACPFDAFMKHPPLIFEHLAQGNSGPIGDWQRPDVQKEDLQDELDKLMPDILLNLASPEETELATLLRKQIKEMSS